MGTRAYHLGPVPRAFISILLPVKLGVAALRPLIEYKFIRARINVYRMNAMLHGSQKFERVRNTQRSEIQT